MGFGLFTYFLGHSQEAIFIDPIWPVFIVLGFVAVKLYRYAKLRFAGCKGSGQGGRLDAAGLVSSGIAGMAALTFVFGIFATGFMLFATADTANMRAYYAARTVVVPAPSEYSIEVVDRYRTDRLLMVNEYSMFYLSELGLKNDYRGQAVIDCFWKQDYLDIIAQLESYEGRVFVAAYLLPGEAFISDMREGLISTVTFADGETFSEKLQRVFAERYVLIAEEGGWMVYDSK
jgi:hypothetical protein